MKLGMLGLTNKAPTLAESLNTSLHNYRSEFGVDPAVCVVNPSLLGNPPTDRKVGDTWVTVSRHVSSGYAWMGQQRPPEAGFKTTSFAPQTGNKIV